MGSSSSRERPLVLVIEDGDEYYETLTRFVSDEFDYEQAKSCAAALVALAQREPDLIFLDMRFDRIDAAELVGDVQVIARRFNGDSARAQRYLVDNQGLYILAELRQRAFRQPAVVSYDFSHEARRLKALQAANGPLFGCPDYASAENMRASLLSALQHLR